jgi:hypothetical protein
MIIDAPVTMWSSPDAIREWILYLEDLRKDHLGDPDTLQDIDAALYGARFNLDVSKEIKRRPNGSLYLPREALNAITAKWHPDEPPIEG